MLEQIKEIINNIGIWNFSLAITLFIISVILNVVLYLRSNKTKKPSYSVRNYELLSDEIKSLDDLSVLWQGNPLKNLTLSRVLI